MNTLDTTAKLITAIYTNDLNAIKQMITLSNVNKVINTKNDYTILHYAALIHETNILKHLIELGGNILLKDTTGKDVYDIATNENKKCIYEHYRNLYKNNETKVKSNDETITILNETIDKLNNKLNTEYNRYTNISDELSSLKRKYTDMSNLYLNEKKNRLELETENKRLRLSGDYKDKYDKILIEKTNLSNENKELKNEKSILENNNKKLVADLEEAENTITRLIKKK